MAFPAHESDSSSTTPKIAATAEAAAGVVAGIVADAVGCCSCCCADPAVHQQQRNSSSGTYGIAADNNLQYTPKLLRGQDAYCTRIIALNPENRQQFRYCEYEQYRTPDI